MAHLLYFHLYLFISLSLFLSLTDSPPTLTLSRPHTLIHKRRSHCLNVNTTSQMFSASFIFFVASDLCMIMKQRHGRHTLLSVKPALLSFQQLFPHGTDTLPFYKMYQFTLTPRHARGDLNSCLWTVRFTKHARKRKITKEPQRNQNILKTVAHLLYW